MDRPSPNTSQTAASSRVRRSPQAMADQFRPHPAPFGSTAVMTQAQAVTGTNELSVRNRSVPSVGSTRSW